MAAMLATLEGNEKGITLDDLFDVNDYLGVKYFGPEDWNRIKKCACIITMKAAKNPVLFYIDSLKDDYKDYKPSELANCVFGFNDAAGRELMGSIPWERLKVKMDNELLGGFSIGGLVRDIGSGIKTAAGYAYDVATAPIKAGEYIIEKTPLKDVPGAKWYKTTKELKEKYVDTPVKSGAQQIVDKTSETMYKFATETPFKYTGAAQIVKYLEKGREAAGITSPGTAEVYESEEEQIRRMRAEEAEARRLKDEAEQKEAEEIRQMRAKEAEARRLKDATEQKAAAEAAAAAAAEELEQTQAVLTSKYAPWVLGGCGLLLALSVLKK